MRFSRFSSIQRRLGIIFLALLCLLVISAVLTFTGLNMQQQDARAISLAGGQRTLLQQISTWAQSTEFDGENENIPVMLAAAKTFDQTLSALRSGGTVQDNTGALLEMTPSSDTAIKTVLDNLQKDWEPYREMIDLLAQSSAGNTQQNAVRQIQDQTPLLIAQTDRVVQSFETVFAGRAVRLRTYQLAFLLAGLALLSTGWWVTSVSIARPLTRLEEDARRIGNGDLSVPVEMVGSSEVQTVSQTMELMRNQILSSRHDLQRWAETLDLRVKQRTRELEALSVVSREINSHLSIEKALTSITQKARVLLGAEVSSLCLLDDEGKVLNLHAAAAPEIAIRSSQSPANGPDVGKVLHQHCAHPCGLDTKQSFCHILAPSFRYSHIAAPLYAKGKVIGALCVGSSISDAFRPEMATVLGQLSDVAVVALENSRLYQQSEYVATLEERQRIAAEMHDGLLQTLSFMRLMVGLLEDQMRDGNTEKMKDTIRQIQRAEEQSECEIRSAIDSLQDNYPLNDSLQDRLSALSNDLSLTQPPVTYKSQVIRPLLLSRQECEQVLRIAREAVLNAQRHSHAERITITLANCDHELVVSVQDCGIGFVPGQDPEDGRAHFGLKVMQARTDRLGGRLSVQSSPGTGTLVQLCWTPGHLSGAGNRL